MRRPRSEFILGRIRGTVFANASAKIQPHACPSGGRLRPRTCQQVLTGALFSVAFLAAIPAWGAPSTWESIGVTLHGIGSDGAPTLTVRGTLTPELVLPAVVQLSVPRAATLRWVGEVHGDNPINDTVAPFGLRSSKACDVLGITMQRARVAQVDMDPPVGWVVEGPRGIFVAMEWTAIEYVGHVRLAFEVASDLHAEQLRPPTAKVTTTDEGTVYAVDASPVDAGDVLTLVGTVVPGADPAPAAAVRARPSAAADLAGTPHRTAPLVLAIAALGVATLLVTLVFALRGGLEDKSDGDSGIG